MKYEYYYKSLNNKSNCVVRSLCKILNREYNDVYNDLCSYANKMNKESFTDISVFEKYMDDNNIKKIDFESDVLIKDAAFDNGSYIVFCYDKNDYYHMVCIIDNTLYDKEKDSLNLYIISVYKKI